MSNHLIKEYDDLKKILKSSDGRELYSHLIECFNNLVLYYPDDALNKLEEISYLLKAEDKSKIREFLNLDNKKDIKTMTECQKQYAELAAGLFKGKAEGGDGEDDAPEPTTAGKITNLHADTEILEWAGISLGQDETYRLQVSLTRLSIMSGSEKIRLWGKIYGTERDYYVAEGFVAAQDEEGEKPQGFEERGTGINQFTYWVTDSSLGKWTMLPDISPEQMKASRSIKVKFTGDLERKIITNPFFFGQEKHYLRAQISRITQSTSIMPSGLHKLQEENVKEIEPIEFENDAKAYKPTTESQSNMSKWVHSVKSILKCNRVSHMEQEGDEGEGESEEVKNDPTEPRLKPITNDCSPSGEDSAWTLRLVGDQSRTLGIKNKSHHYGVVVVKSTVWNGSVLAWREDRSVQVYIGDGLKSEKQTYYPVYPPTIPEDPEDLTECPEPTPLEAPPADEGEAEPAAAENPE
jgi:radial spoke head protein 4A